MSKRRVRLLLVVIAVYVVGTIVARQRGYKVGGATIVRCRAGHLFTTIWIPGASLKAVRLGAMRIQYCPVGHHFTVVRPVKGAELTEEMREEAALCHDARIP